MTKLFRDVKVGDKIYWVYKDHWNKIHIEEYKIWDISNPDSNGRVILKTTVSMLFCVNLNDCVDNRKDSGSFVVLDQDGVKWAINKIKRQIVKEYTERIDNLREKITEALVDVDYIIEKK